MGSETAIWSSLLVLVLVAIAAGAAIFGMISTARTWQISAQHEPFRASAARHGLRGRALYARSRVMQVRRHFLSVMVMAACLLAIPRHPLDQYAARGLTSQNFKRGANSC